MAPAEMRRLLATLLLALSACDHRTQKVSDQSIRDLREQFPGITARCIETIKFGGLEAMPTGVDRCFDMQPPRRWTGLWNDEFEGSRFCPAPAKACSFSSPGDRVWLTYSEDAGPPSAQSSGDLYAIEFVGRRTLRRGRYGHMGGSQHEVLVDRVISITPVHGGQHQSGGVRNEWLADVGPQ